MGTHMGKQDKFKRKKADLLLEKKISLSEALCGCNFTVQHLDGRELYVSSPQGKIIKDQELMAIDSEGMPYEGNPFTKGKLFVLFTVKFPTSGSLSAAQLQVLQTHFCVRARDRLGRIHTQKEGI